MKKLIILTIVFLGFATTSFAFSVTGFVNVKNHSISKVVKNDNSNNDKTYKYDFVATDRIAAIAAGTLTITKSANSANTTTDNLIVLVNREFYSSTASYEIIINGVTVVSDTLDYPGTYLSGYTIPISEDDVITVNFYHVSGNPDSNREIWFEYDDNPRTFISDALENDSAAITTLTYIHQKNPNGSSDVNLNISDWPF